MVECVLMSVGSLGPADSKFIFLNIRKRRSKICNFYDTWKRRVEILCFSKCLEKKWGLHTPRSLPINLNMKITSCWQHWRCTAGWGVFSMYFFFQYVYLKYTNAVASLLISLCRIQLFWYWILSVSVFFCHLLWGCFIRLLENDWCCQKPCINQLIVDKMVECVLMSVGSLGPADSKFIFLNIRKRRSKICNFYDTWKRRVEILCFSKCLG